MKKNILIISCVLFAVLQAFMPNTEAATIAGSNHNYDYLLGGADFSKFSMGVYSRERSILVGFPFGGFSHYEYEMEMKKIQGYIGYDVLRWATIYLIGGTADTRLHTPRVSSANTGYGGAEGEIGAGILMNLIDHDIADPALQEDRIRVTAGIEYTSSKSTIAYASANGIDATAEWEELFASLTISFINQIDGNRTFWPNGIAIFGGPIYSHLQSSSLEHDGDVGFTGGLSLIYSDAVTIDMGVERLESAGFFFGGNIKF